MVFFLKLLYLLQTLPIFIKENFLKKVNGVFLKFLWKRRPPPYQIYPTKVNETIWRNSNRRYRAILWSMSFSENPRLESKAQIDFPLISLPWCKKGVTQEIRFHPTIGPTWKQHKKWMDQKQLYLTQIYLVIGNPEFRAAMEDLKFRSLINTEGQWIYKYIDQGRWIGRERMNTETLGINLPFSNKIQLDYFLKSLGDARVYSRQLTTF